MNKKRFLAILGVVLMTSTLLVSFLAGCAKPAPGLLEFRYATDETPTHERYTNVVIPFQRKIEADTNHQVRITSFPAASLIAAKDIFDSVLKGSVEMGDANTLYTPNRFKLTEAVTIPGIGRSTPYIITMAIWDLYRKFPEVQAESAGIKLFWLWSLPGPYIYSNKPIKTMADLKGMKIRSYPGPGFDAMAALGGTPVNVSWPSIYEAMEKKTIDAFVANPIGIVPMKYYEVCKYATEFNLGGMCNWGGMNLNVYNGLSKDIQKAIDSATGDVLAKQFAEMLGEYDGRMEAEQAKQGVQKITLAADEYQRWMQATAGVPAKWANDMNAQKLPGTAIVDFVKERFAFYAKK